MSFNREFEVNENQVADYLESAVQKVKTTEDVETLSSLVKLFKKNVPLSLRKYVIAYMLKDELKHFHSFNNNSRRERNNNRSRNEFKQNNRSERAQEVKQEAKPVEERPRHPRVEIDPSEADSIFISIGKNRRVFPRDLVGLLIAVAGIDRDRIGDIKVLANYSFVQLYSSDAQLAIEKLNGYSYRGRELSVSPSRQKSLNADALAEGKVNSGYVGQFDSDDSITEEQMAAEDAAAYAAAEKAAVDKEPFGL